MQKNIALARNNLWIEIALNFINNLFSKRLSYIQNVFY
jgi:hypothetical protein